MEKSNTDIIIESMPLIIMFLVLCLITNVFLGEQVLFTFLILVFMGQIFFSDRVVKFVESITNNI